MKKYIVNSYGLTDGKMLQHPCGCEVYLASEVDEIVEDVQLWLRLDQDIRHRLEIPHGWNSSEIASHRNDLKMRDEIRARLKSVL